MVDVEYLRDYYDSLDDEELDRLARGELVPEARAVLEAEMRSRNLPWPSSESTGASLGARHHSEPRNPYSPPVSVVADPSAAVVVTVSGLIRLFQGMVIASTLIGIVLLVWPYLPIPVAEGLQAFRQEAGAGAVWFTAAEIIYFALQPFWILTAFGLCFFKWWARPVFVATYVLSAVQNLLGGLAIWLPWELVLITMATLLDGAILALAYLPPLSTYFAQDRG